jgi:hypothetical protein
MMQESQDSPPERNAQTARSGWFARGLGWWLARRRRMVIAVAILVASFFALRVAPAPTSLADPWVLRMLASLLLVATFLGMVAVAGGVGRERSGDAAMRALSGAMTGAGVALIFGAGVGLAALFAACVAAVGYFASRWIRWL